MAVIFELQAQEGAAPRDLELAAALLADYRLRVATVVRDYGLQDREQAPRDSQITLV